MAISLPEDHPSVARAVEALRGFGGDLDRDAAVELLPHWRHLDDLDRDQYRRVLAAFPSADAPASPEPGTALPGGGWADGTPTDGDS